jgi:prepilin-type processing-associated H-X9-DG protein
VLVYLLPFVEQDNLYKLFTAQLPADYLDPTKNYPAFYRMPGTSLQAAQQVVKTFLCPADLDTPPGTVGYLLIDEYNPPINSGGWVVGGAFGKTNYLGVAGYGGLTVPQYAGPFNNRTQVPLNKIAGQDGTSNTFMFGEATGYGDTGGPPAYAFAWALTSPMAAAWGTPTGQSGIWYAFTSRHTGVVQFAYCDGSVHGIRKGMTQGNDWLNYVNMSGWSDGQVADQSQIAY